MKMVLVFIMLFQCHQESAQFNIVSVLLNIIFKYDFKKLLNSLEFFLFNVRGMKTFWAILNFVVGVPKPLKRSGWGIKTLCQMLPRLKNFFNSSKIPSTLVPGIKNDYSLKEQVKFLKFSTVLKNNLQFILRFLKLLRFLLRVTSFCKWVWVRLKVTTRFHIVKVKVQKQPTEVFCKKRCS